MNPFSDDGHLHDLGLELFLAGALGDRHADAAAHVGGCPACARRVAAAREVVVPPRRVPAPANRSFRLWFAGVAAAAVAVVAFAVGAPDEVPGDGWRSKGADLAFEVHRATDGGSDRVRDGAAVHPGERLGFRVRARSGGHLLIAGFDGSSSYLCFPQMLGGASAPFAGGEDWFDVPEAIRLDDRLGDERLVAVVCDAPIAIGQLGERLDAALPEGCRSAEVRLRKEVR